MIGSSDNFATLLLGDLSTLQLFASLLHRKPTAKRLTLAKGTFPAEAILNERSDSLYLPFRHSAKLFARANSKQSPNLNNT